MRKNILKYSIFLVAIPLVIILGVVLFSDRQYAWITFAITILACIPFFVRFETKETETKELIIIAVMVALSVLGRFAFSFIPHFKPVTAIVVITGIYLGTEAGFLCGALSAVVSNFIFGQGPWTPFQMFAWGILGLMAAFFANPLKKSKLLLLLYGGLAGVLYSWILDIWTVLWWDGVFNWTRYLTAIVTAIPTTVTYIVSNIIFLWILSKPIGEKLDRIKIKYGL